MVRVICQIIGIIFMLFGLVGMLTPIPFGIIFFAIGLMFLLPTSPWLVRFIQKLRRKYRRVDNVFHSMTRRAPTPYKRVLRETEVPGAHHW